MNKIMIMMMMIVSVANAYLQPRMPRIRLPVITDEYDTKYSTTKTMRPEEIFNILEPLSNNIAQLFKLENEDICKYISISEIEIYLHIGLMKSVEQLTSTDNPCIFGKYCMHTELKDGVILLVQEIQTEEYIKEWKDTQKSIKQKGSQGLKESQRNIMEHMLEHFGEEQDIRYEKEIISLFTYLKLWEYINSLSPILKSAFMRKYSEYEFHPKHMYSGCIVV